MNKLKQKIINFAFKNKKLILKIVPTKVIGFFERHIVSSTNNFVRTTKIDKSLKKGINFVAPIKGQFGLGQGSRLIYKSVEKSKYKSALINTYLNMEDKSNDMEYHNKIQQDFPYNINIISVQPHTMFEIALSEVNVNNLKGRYNIAYWLYELENIPEKWLTSFKYVNEIWTPSDFVTNAFKKVSPVPVYTIPYGISVKNNYNKTKSDFGIVDGKFTFLILYDASSLSSRKNPQAAINAFVNAFRNNDDVCLVLKVSSANKDQIDEINKNLQSIKHYTIINDVLSKDDVYNLISLCDVYVSLHRSEGFGLVMAEAMALGTVCIATNYSGNLQFMNKDNSCLIDYKLIDVDGSNSLIYKEGEKWADADVLEASKYMKKLYSDKDFYNKLKSNALEYVKKNMTFENTTKMIENRINKILKENEF